MRLRNVLFLVLSITLLYVGCRTKTSGAVEPDDVGQEYPIQLCADSVRAIATTPDGMELFIDLLGRPCSRNYRELQRFSNYLAAFTLDKETWGYVNCEDTIVIPPSFKEAGFFNEGYALVRPNAETWYEYPVLAIDSTGRTAFGPVLHVHGSLNTFYNGIVKINESYFDKRGRGVTDLALIDRYEGARTNKYELAEAYEQSLAVDVYRIRNGYGLTYGGASSGTIYTDLVKRVKIPDVAGMRSARGDWIVDTTTYIWIDFFHPLRGLDPKQVLNMSGPPSVDTSELHQGLAQSANFDAGAPASDTSEMAGANPSFVSGARTYDIKELEIAPSYPGGEEALFGFLGRSIHYPQAEQDSGIQGVVYVEFTVAADGSIRDASTLRGVSMAIDTEALRVIQSMPRWTPGRLNNSPVDVRYRMPIRFSLQ